MKKKINLHSLKHLNTILLFILWSLSIIMTFYMLTVFGWRINHPYNKEKEKKYRKRIDSICHVILCIWCLFALTNLVLYGPFYIIYYVTQNIIYIILTLLTTTIWLDRKYHTDNKYRNLLVVISLWNLSVYVITFLLWLSSSDNNTKKGFELNLT